VVGLMFTLEYEDADGDVHWLKVHKVHCSCFFTDGNDYCLSFMLHGFIDGHSQLIVLHSASL